MQLAHHCMGYYRRGEITYTHTTAKCFSTCTLWRASRLTLVACVYKAPSAISSVITVTGMREKITAAITGSNTGLPPFVILLMHAPRFLHHIVDQMGPACIRRAAAEG